MSHTLIPKPPIWRYAAHFSSIRQMSPQEKRLLTIALLSEWSTWPQRTLCWTRQEAEHLGRFKRKMIERCPFLSKYEEAWPVEGLMREWLARAPKDDPVALDEYFKKKLAGPRRRGRPSTKQVMAHSQPIELSGDEDDEIQIIEKPSNYDSRDKEVVITSTPILRSKSCKRSPTAMPTADSESRNVSLSKNIISSVLRPGSDFNNVSASQPPPTIFAFLSSLNPNLACLTHRFTEGGIWNEERLAGLAAMPASTRDKFLRADLSLDAFEAAIVRVGLQKSFPSKDSDA